jgi:quinol monooxygenase YgiN
MSQVTNLAFFRARRGQSEALAALVEPTRLEAGCLNYDLDRSVDDADVWFVYENWRSPEGCRRRLHDRLIAFSGGTHPSARRLPEME